MGWRASSTGFDIGNDYFSMNSYCFAAISLLESYLSPTVTHVVTPVDNNDLCSRTMKFLLGVITGKWIISYDCE